MVFEAAALLDCNSSQPPTTEKVAQKWPRKLEAFANRIVNAPLFISYPRRTLHSDSCPGSLIWELRHLRSRLRTMTGCVPATPTQSPPVACSRFVNLERMNAARIPEVQTADVKSSGTELRVREETARPRFLPKTHVAFWRARVERRTYDYEGKTLEVPEYSVRMKYGGIRRRLG